MRLELQKTYVEYNEFQEKTRGDHDISAPEAENEVSLGLGALRFAWGGWLLALEFKLGSGPRTIIPYPET